MNSEKAVDGMEGEDRGNSDVERGVQGTRLRFCANVMDHMVDEIEVVVGGWFH